MQQNKSSCKIYSRNRLKIFRPKKYSKTYKKFDSKVFFIVIVCVIAMVVCLIFCKSINPIFETICSSEAQAIATKITNEESGKAMENYDYNDLFTIEKDDER